jgi:hypothetical protein
MASLTLKISSNLSKNPVNIELKLCRAALWNFCGKSRSLVNQGYSILSVQISYLIQTSSLSLGCKLIRLVLHQTSGVTRVYQAAKENLFMLKRQWHSSVAILTALSLGAGTISQLIGFEVPATARTAAQQSGTRSRIDIAQSLSSGQIRRGTVLDVAEPNGKRIIVLPDETARVTLVTTQSVRSQTALIPEGTKIEGEFRPAGDGTQFVARRIIFRDGTSQSIDGRSNIVNYRKTIQKGSTDPIWQGALVGGGASVLISSIVTKPGIAKTLAGAGAGALAGYLLGGRRKSTEVIVVRPNEPLTLTLDSNLILNNRY